MRLVVAVFAAAVLAGSSIAALAFYTSASSITVTGTKSNPDNPEDPNDQIPWRGEGECRAASTMLGDVGSETDQVSFGVGDGSWINGELDLAYAKIATACSDRRAARSGLSAMLGLLAAVSAALLAGATAWPRPSGPGGPGGTGGPGQPATAATTAPAPPSPSSTV